MRYILLSSGLSFFAFLSMTGPVQAQLPANPPYDGRPALARIRFAAVSDPSGCQDADGLGDGGWSHDYPMSVQGLMKAATELTSLQAPVDSFVTLSVMDSTFMKYPISMMTEPGCWNPTEAEAKMLQAYLRKGGFLLLDDMTFSDESPDHMELAIERTETWLKRVLVDGKLVPVPASDAIFDGFFQISSQEIPRGGSSGGGTLYGVYEDNDPSKRLMVIATYRGALRHNWRWVNGLGSGLGERESPSGQAYRLGLNILVYGLSH